MYIVERTCTDISKKDSEPRSRVVSQSLAFHQDLPAYVLLAAPGAGKTTIFESEAKQSDALYVSARDLISFDDRAEWHGKTLFIDGLDEVRAGQSDVRTSFDTIRARLNTLGCPKFRLSCREADWFGASDKKHLASVSKDGDITVLHLDDLSEKNIVEILENDRQVTNVQAFLQAAKDRGLHELLYNPHILNLMIKAVSGDNGQWPETRSQTFFMACNTIVQEYNDEHQVAEQSLSIDIKGLLDAAGFLCAVQLIAGNAGYSRLAHRVDKSGYNISDNSANDSANNDFPVLNNPAFENIDSIKRVIRTNLFKTLGGERLAPVHRQLAEFLAARYLADRIEQKGLPIGRILALITGEDGVVVAELRGLAAWLAALCIRHRRTLIERDPLGVVLYGDVQNFSPQDKATLLESLQTQASRNPWFRSSDWSASPFGVLSTPDMEHEFRNILTDADRDDARQSLVECVLDAMMHGGSIQNLADVLWDILQDATRWFRIRSHALDIILAKNKDNSKHFKQLKTLAGDINQGTVEDASDELMGCLLRELYPRVITAAEVWDYFHAAKQKSLIGEYRLFWLQHLLEISSDENVSVLLDEMVLRLGILQSPFSDHDFIGVSHMILLRGLEVHGESIQMQRLYDWLGVGLDQHGFYDYNGENLFIAKIREWLQARPDVLKGIISIGVGQCNEKESGGGVFRVKERLYGSKLPTDFGQWCLTQMKATNSEHVTKFLLREAVNALVYGQGDANLSLEKIQNIAKLNTNHRIWLDEMLVCILEPSKRVCRNTQRNYQAKKHKEAMKWIRQVKSYEASLRDGGAPSSLLNKLATSYFGYFSDSVGTSPMERLRNHLDQDEGLVLSSLVGIKNSLHRDDNPSVTDIIKLYSEDRSYLISRVILAALQEISAVSLSDFNQLSDEQIKMSIAFYLVDGTGEDPDWYKLLLIKHPELISEVLMQYVVASFRSKKDPVNSLCHLAQNDEYKLISRKVSLLLLEAFPARCTNQQIAALDHLLNSALRYFSSSELLPLIKNKLALGSMNVAQRVHWFAAGLLVDPKTYLQVLVEYVDAKEKRIHHLANFLTKRHVESISIDTTYTLVKILGKFFAPYQWEYGVATWVSPAMNTADVVKSLITQLGARPEMEASVALAKLLQDKNLIRWRKIIQRVQFEQSSVRREAGFKHVTVAQVSETLLNKSPANVADLAALMTELIRDLGRHIHNDNTDDYRQYWNEGPKRQLVSPKHEDACRDALLSNLKMRLAPFNIAAEPEGHYANDKRADIRISFGGATGISIPIEAKKNSHKNLWRAIHEQLIPLYTRDPSAHGYGIYLVFWFGNKDSPRPPSGSRPRSAEELESRLCSTLSEDERRKISVCVLDVSN